MDSSKPFICLVQVFVLGVGSYVEILPVTVTTRNLAAFYGLVIPMNLHFPLLLGEVASQVGAVSTPHVKPRLTVRRVLSSDWLNDVQTSCKVINKVITLVNGLLNYKRVIEVISPLQVELQPYNWFLGPPCWYGFIEV